MKRRAFKLVLFLLAGAIINVVVAWSGVVWKAETFLFVEDREPYPTSLVQRIPTSWLGMALEHHGGAINIYSHCSSFACASDDLCVIAGVSEWSRSYEQGTLDVYYVCGGWPLKSLEGHAVSESSVANSGAEKVTRTGALPVPSVLLGKGQVSTVRDLLPYQVRPTGFAINTIFYAAILFALFAVPAAVRRRVRRMRGQCVWCAYPIGENSVCSECGKPVRSERVEPTS